MYIRRSLLLSVGIHFTLIVSAIVLANIVRTPLPQSEKELILKVLLSPVAQKPEVTPVQPPVPAKKEPRPIQKIVPAPVMPSTIKPSIQPNPVPTPVVSQPAAAPTSVATAKTAESDAPKKAAPPPPPKVEEYEDNHLGEIRSILAERLKYPKNARRLNQQGEVSVTFTLSQNGEVSQIAITKSSGFDLLDEAARALITAASPEFPKPSKSVRITVPISYTLR
ncbi:MAG: energy transducer TonB [Sulfuricurvum sp.]|uniref:energy transducer TonB n=1 Tax=Sulfuricurvum sp. TaxID=2025608 RepID=UPI0035641BD6